MLLKLLVVLFMAIDRKYSDIATCHPLKILNAIGDGGFLVTDNKNVYNFINKYKNHGLVGRDNVEIFGVNSRLDSILQAF